MAKPASNRLISSRSVSSSSKRSSSAWSSSALRATAGSNSSRSAKIRSAAIRTVVSGVRSSCETSEVNRRCSRDISSSRRICRCRLVAIWLNEAASRARSSSPLTTIRWSSRPAESRWAVRAATRTGVTTSRVTRAASRPSRSTRATPGGQHGGAGIGGGGVLPGQRDEVVELHLAEPGRHRRAVDQVFGAARRPSRPVRIWLATLPPATAARSSRLSSGRTFDVRRGARLDDPGVAVGGDRHHHPAGLLRVAAGQVVDRAVDGVLELRLLRLAVEAELLGRVVAAAAQPLPHVGLGVLQQDGGDLVGDQVGEPADQQAGGDQGDA